MIGVIAQHELRRLTRDRRAVGLVAALIALAALAGYTGWVRERAARDQVSAAQTAARADWLSQGEKNPHAAAHYGQVLARPRSALTFLVPGVDPYSGVTIKLEAHARHPAAARPASEDTELARFGLLSPALIVEVLAPLAIILLGFGLVADERERGTLRQLLATGAPAGRLLAGKALGLSAAVAGAAALPGLALIGMALATGDGPSTTARAGALALCWGLYLAAWLAVTIAVSAWSRRSHGALVGLVGLWVATVVVAPRVAAEWGHQLAPPASPIDRARAVKARTRADKKARRKAFLAEVLAEHGVEKKADLPVNFDALWLQHMEEFDNQVFDDDLREIRGRFAAHDRFGRIFTWLSPTLAVRRLGRAAAGTDRRHMEHFSDAAEGYRRLLVGTLNGTLAKNSRTGDWDYKAGEELWSAVPAFDYQALSAAEALAPARSAALALLVWLAGGLVSLSIAAGHLARGEGVGR